MTVTRAHRSRSRTSNTRSQCVDRECTQEKHQKHTRPQNKVLFETRGKGPSRPSHFAYVFDKLSMMNHCQITPTQRVQLKPETCRPGAVVHPTDMDIILGRGVLHANHPGNQRFYSIIDKYLPLYDAATSRADKTKVVQTIFETITSAGRFVKDDAESAACIVIETKKAKKKISHAIRFRRQAGKPSAAAEARKLKPVVSSSSPKPSPSPQSVKKLQELQQPKLLSQQDSLHGLTQNSLSGFMQNRFAASRTRVSATSLDCIIPDEELDSVLLLPQDEMEMVSQAYGNLLWKDLIEDKISDSEKVGRSNSIL